MITLYSVAHDEVIRSTVAPAVTTYGFALSNLYPLIDKFEEQRKVQRKKFYERLRADIIKGCIMPPITLAFVNPGIGNGLPLDDAQDYVTANMHAGYILDGMQRLNTLYDASSQSDFRGELPLYVNVIIAERYDLLLYRMITLNNGQKPMTARHQIEMLTKGMLDTDNMGIVVVSEKDTEVSKPQGAFKRGDIAAAYTAFLTNSVHNENSRIIENKLDEILVNKVMASNLTESQITFSDVLSHVERLSKNHAGRDWLRLANNLIGFSVGAKTAHPALLQIEPDVFASLTETFEEGFSALNVSKINVGKYRRDLSRIFVAGISKYRDYDADDLTNVFNERTMVE